MTSSTITGYIDTILNFQWDLFWDENSNKGLFLPEGANVTVSPFMFLGFAGGGIAFLLNLLGSLENSS